MQLYPARAASAAQRQLRSLVTSARAASRPARRAYSRHPAPCSLAAPAPVRRHRLSDVQATREGRPVRKDTRPARAEDGRPLRPGQLPKLEFAHPESAENEMRSFLSPPLSGGLLHMVQALLGERAHPTTPQAQALAHFFEEDRKPSDTLIAAETGSGKTLAYLLPALQRLHDTRAATEHADRAHVRSGGDARLMPRCVVLAPTHELARQIAEVAKSLCHDASHKLRVACMSTTVWDANLDHDLARLRECANEQDVGPAPTSPDVLVATPGRLLEVCVENQGAAQESARHAVRRCVSLRNVQTLVVDEADTLLDHGFEPDTTRILHAVRRRDHPVALDTIFATATIPRTLTEYFRAHHPRLTTLASPALHRLPKKLSATFVDPGSSKHLAVLKELFRIFTTPGLERDRVLIFCDRRTGVRQLSSYLDARGVENVALTGEADSRHTRTDAQLQRFLVTPRAREPAPRGREDPRVLITTSLLSRGLDFGPDVRHVFLPDAGRRGGASTHAANNNALELLHRAGRSARAGRAGSVVLFDRESAPGRSKVLINRRGQKRGVVRGQMDLLVRQLRHRSRS